MNRLFVISALLFFPVCAVAYVPGIVPLEGAKIVDTSVRHMFFGELKEDSGVVRLSLPEGGNLNLFLLTPIQTAFDKRYDAVIVSESRGEVTAVLESGSLSWEPYHDAYTAEDFLKGPELSKVVPPGDYRIVVNNAGNQGKFAIVIGSNERFSIADYYALYKLGPNLKQDFFGQSPFAFVYSWIGFGFTLAYVLCGVLLGFIMSRTAFAITTWKKLWGRYAHSLLVELISGVSALLIALVLLFATLATNWSIALFVLSGCFFYYSLSCLLRLSSLLK